MDKGWVVEYRVDNKYRVKHFKSKKKASKFGKEYGVGFKKFTVCEQNLAWGLCWPL